MPVKVSSKRMSLLLASLCVSTLVALTIGVNAGVAANQRRDTEKIQYQNDTCDNTDNGNDMIGKVKFGYKPNKNTLSMTVNLTDALGSTTYTIYLLDPGSCTPIGGALGTVTTKSNGRGRIKLTVDVTGHDQFVLDANDGTNHNTSRVADFS